LARRGEILTSFIPNVKRNAFIPSTFKMKMPIEPNDSKEKISCIGFLRSLVVNF
jgi:hypothetical protein